MVLIMLGRIGPEHVDRGNSSFWELLSRSIALLVSQVRFATISLLFHSLILFYMYLNLLHSDYFFFCFLFRGKLRRKISIIMICTFMHHQKMK